MILREIFQQCTSNELRVLESSVKNVCGGAERVTWSWIPLGFFSLDRDSFKGEGELISPSAGEFPPILFS